MKIQLFDIENLLDRDVVFEAHELIKMTRELDITNPEPEKYHIISKQPDYHVEASLKPNGIANAKCNCMVYKKTAVCRHVTAALLLLRDHLKGDRKSHKKHNKEIIDEVLQKLSAAELKSFISAYATSHSQLRSDILSNYLYLTRKPDYHHLFNDLAPIDKFGQIRINRNSIKTIRNVSSTLLRRAQQLLQEKSLTEALLILEAVLTHLHRLHGKVQQFQEQLMVELKFAYRLFETLCIQEIAPRLQIRAITLATDLCERDTYVFPAGMNPLLQFTEPFLLEEKTRKEAMSISERKILQGSNQSLRWATLLNHWRRKWQLEIHSKQVRQKLTSILPEMIREHALQNEHEDVLFALGQLDKEKLNVTELFQVLQAGLRAARSTGQSGKMVAFAYELAIVHLDIPAWQQVYETDPEKAEHALAIINDMYQPGADKKADTFLLSGWAMSGAPGFMIHRLKEIGDPDLIAVYDHHLKEKDREGLVDLYAAQIRTIKDTYGGVAARQRLHNIFSHLKDIGLHGQVSDKIKQMEQLNETLPRRSVIKGFVFDLDGVIVDTAVHHFKAWKEIFGTLGAAITEEDDQHTRGAGRMESLEYLLNQYHIVLSEEEKVEWAARKNNLYLQSIKSVTPGDLLPGALAFIEEARQEGLLIALGSASKNAMMVLDKLQIAKHFHAIIDGTQTKASKPDPEIFIKACAALGLEPNNVVVFEDAPKGVEAALRAGCHVVGIGDASNLSNAHMVVTGLHEIRPHQIIEHFA